jgi:hypothetical protein
VRRARSLRLEYDKIRGIRQSMFTEEGMLYRVLRVKAKLDKAHLPYVRVELSGMGAFYGNPDKEEKGDAGFGSFGVLELWASGILLGFTGEIFIKLYERLDWELDRDGLITLRQDPFAWLDPTHGNFHKLACGMDEKMFRMSFLV